MKRDRAVESGTTFTLRRPAAATLSALVLTALGTLGCAPDAPPPTEPAARADVSELSSAPNVSRFESPFTFGVLDETADLFLLGGPPIDISQWRACGGDQRPSIAYFQFSAQLTDALKILVRNPDLPVHVYRWSQLNDSFGGDVCTAPTVALGLGRATYADNDGSVSLTRTNTFRFQVTGILDDVQNGGKATVEAMAHFFIYRDGSSEVRTSRIQLMHLAR